MRWPWQPRLSPAEELARVRLELRAYDETWGRLQSWSTPAVDNYRRLKARLYQLEAAQPPEDAPQS